MSKKSHFYLLSELPPPLANQDFLPLFEVARQIDTFNLGHFGHLATLCLLWPILGLAISGLFMLWPFFDIIWPFGPFHNLAIL
jgi:hypothetical protein